MTKLVLDPSRSLIRIQTFAEGLFSRLAHDLELVCRDVSGTAEVSAEGRVTASVIVPVAGIAVRGTLSRGRLDETGLSPSERRDCLAKMRDDVFHVAHDDAAVVRVDVTSEAGRATLRVVPPKGRDASGTIAVRTIVDLDGSTRAEGKLALSLEAIGSLPVKGPMNAFRVKDAVDILFDAVFRPV